VSRLHPTQEVTTTLTIKMRVHPQVNVNHLLAEAHVILCDREAQKQGDRGAQQQEVEVPVLVQNASEDNGTPVQEEASVFGTYDEIMVRQDCVYLFQKPSLPFQCLIFL